MSEDIDGAKDPERPGGLPRKAPRVEVNADVLVRRTSGNSYRVRVFDLSPHGCKVEFIERPTLDERIWIKFEGLDGLEGKVRWIDSFLVGVDFTRPMHDAVFDHVVKRLG